MDKQNSRRPSGDKPEFTNEKLARAEKATEDNPYDLESWSLLIREAQSRTIQEGRPIFEKLVSIFPTGGRFWKIYIEQEMRARNFERVEKLFQRCLMKVLNIDLWKLYLTYVRETKSTLPTYKEKLAQAYDFAIDRIGMDISSHNIWSDYIQFLRQVDAVGSYAENQKTSAVRRIYQRGVVNPMTNIEQLWKEYITYEQSVNPLISDKMIAEHSRDYMTARRVAKEFEAITRGLNRSAPSVPPQGTPEENKQVDIWKKYISWEKENPLRTEDRVGHTRRVMFAYEQCLLCLSHHPHVWYEAALFLENAANLLMEKGDVTASRNFSEEVAGIYERAISGVLKECMLLYFAYAEYEEGRIKYDKVHSIYKRYLDISTIDPTLVYVQYMKFARRAEGIKSARAVFKKAREDERSKAHVYVAAALMEYYCSKDKNIAFKIFELGLKKFSSSPQYILSYIDYLSHLNEDNNTRVLFERVLSSGSLSPENSVEIWNKFLEFECNIGDLSSIVKVEKRRANVLKEIKEFEGKETALLVDRYKFLDLFPCTPFELKSIGYKQVSKVANLGASSSVLSSLPMDLLFDDNIEQHYPRPDTSQMLPFKPKLTYYPGEHSLPGGGFPLPPSAADFCSRIPPPRCFEGPFVKIDKLIENFATARFPDGPEALANGTDGNEKFFEYAKSVHWVIQDDSSAKKRKADDSDEEDSLNAPPVNDIYRQRQQKRVR